MAARYTFRLKPERDADLIAWLDDLGDGERSCFIRDALRRSLHEPASSRLPHPAQFPERTSFQPASQDHAESDPSDIATRLDQLTQSF